MLIDNSEIGIDINAHRDSDAMHVRMFYPRGQDGCWERGDDDKSIMLTKFLSCRIDLEESLFQLQGMRRQITDELFGVEK